MKKRCIRLFQQTFFISLGCVGFLALSGCVPSVVVNDVHNVRKLTNHKSYLDAVAESSNSKTLVVETPLFPIQTVGRITDPSKPLVVYVEGDGHVFEGTSLQISNDPTPDNPVALQLSAIDRSPNVVYIARPCQYVGNINDTSYPSKQCVTSQYWTDARYSPEADQAVSIALHVWKSRLPEKTGVHLVGYSGGAMITGVLAATRRDTLSWRTVAGLVDQVSFLKSQGKKAYGRSINLRAYRRILQNIPQTHYVGTQDKILPDWILKGFLDSYPRNNCALIVSIPALHDAGWLQPWLNYWTNLPVCS